MTIMLRCALLLLLAVPARATAWDVSLSPDSRVWLEGDSTLHPFSSTATAVDFSLRVEGKGAGLDEALASGAAAALTLRIPVAGLKSGHAGLDKNLRKALKADAHPDIVFTLSKYELQEGGAALEMVGELRIAGAARPVAVGADLERAGGRLAAEGRVDLSMSDFGVKPPSLMMGAIKVADRVAVKYRLELRATPAVPDAGGNR